MAHQPVANTVPGPVRYSVICWIAACVVYVLGTLVTFVSAKVRPGGVLAGQGAGPGQEATATTLLVLMTAAVLALSAVIVFFAVKMRAGRAWARIVLTVGGVLLALSNLPSILGSGADDQPVDPGLGPVLTSITAGVASLLMLVAVVLQWLPTAHPHFAAPPYGVAGPGVRT